MAHPAREPGPGDELGGYRILERIGRGGMGVVFRAEHLRLGRTAALKVIAPELAADRDFHDRFNREARAAATLQHPAVVTVYDAGEDDGVLYLAMQLIDGSDLDAVLAAHGRLSPEQAVAVCADVAAALDAAHDAGLVHRDVKPANVLTDGKRSFLSDFGLTHHGGHGPTRAGELVGSLHYAAPEQIQGGPVDGRADEYALASVLVHCLTGEPPFVRDTEVAVMYAQLHDEPPRPSERRPELRPAIDAVIAGAMDKRPERRFGSCTALVGAAASALGLRLGAIRGAGVPLPDHGADGKRRVPEEGDPAHVRTIVRARADVRGSSGDHALPAGERSEHDPAAVAAGERSEHDPVATPAGEPATADPAGPPRALLVDIDAQSRAVARIALVGWELIDADPDEAPSASARRHRPALVLMGADPGAAHRLAPEVQAIHEDPATGQVRVMLAVAWEAGSGRQLRTVGADETIATPFSPLQLQVKLRRLLDMG